MSKASGLTRGDRRRNARKARLRAMVPAANAVVGLDLGERKQALVVTGADGQVLARRSPRVGTPSPLELRRAQEPRARPRSNPRAPSHPARSAASACPQPPPAPR
jgi:hypothetical protein